MKAAINALPEVEICSEPGITCHDSADTLRGSLQDVAGLAELFRALSDETRTKIIYLLSQQELCICDLAYLLDISQPAVSHHMRLLKAMRLVRSRRSGKMVFYTLDDDHVPALITVAREHYGEQK